GNAYSTSGPGKYTETEKLCIVLTGKKNEDSWKQKSVSSDFYSLKGAVGVVLKVLGITPDTIEIVPASKLDNHIVYKLNLLTGKAGNQIIAGTGEVKKSILDKFGIKQPVFFADLNWAVLSELASKQTKAVKEISKYPAVQRDVALIVPKEMAWEQVQQTVQKIKLNKLQDIKLFDIFESEKLGAGKKSVAVNFTFLDEEKTLTDKEIDGWMNKIMTTLEKDLQAEIRK
ncbi:MAG: phenylalanine--tRNA ligase subunit beta, partial [Chitinophagaceae bacterium]|nr:phenylalanine--tRNA ligase subunit beta [Chitinophagaceae bacterium]